MASSKKSPHRDLRAHVAGVLAKTVTPGHCLVLGLSGGIDSMVLLDILKSLSRKLRFKLSAVHVNHQLSPNAMGWARFCERQCRACGLALRVAKVKVTGAGERGLEAAAREARYRIYRKQPADYIVLAHHLDDQAETLLLQLLRGSGVKGSSAMPDLRIVDRGFESRQAGLCLLRPLLDVPRSEIERYARLRKLKWIGDESNDNVRFDRNFLRHKVFPVIAKHFPAYRETLGRTVRHFAEAAQLLDELAGMDWRGSNRHGRLQVAALRELAPARAKNLLRNYLTRNNVPLPSARKLDEILHQLAGARGDARVRIVLGQWEVRRFKGEVYICGAQPDSGDLCIRWQGEPSLSISQLNGIMSFRRSKGKGIAYARLAGKPVTIRLRQGGEKLRPDGRRPRRSLKNLLQESAITPWERSRLPLLFVAGRLVFVPGIGIDSDYQAKPGEAGLSVKWDMNYTGNSSNKDHKLKNNRGE